MLRKFVEARVHFAEFVAARRLRVRLALSFTRGGFAVTRIVGIAAFIGRVALDDRSGISFAPVLLLLVTRGVAMGSIVAPWLRRLGVAGLTIRIVFALGFVPALIALVATGVAIRATFVTARAPLVLGCAAIPLVLTLRPVSWGVIRVAMAVAFWPTRVWFAVVRSAIRSGFAPAFGATGIVGVAMSFTLALRSLATAGVAKWSAFASLRHAV